MRLISHACGLLVLAAAGSLAVPVAHAAESYEGCAGFIDSLPTTISTQGVWCLRSDLSTAMTSGAAITVANNNVTIDCNDFKVGGLAGGEASTARGIRAVDRLNTTVRNCAVRGFFFGIELLGESHGGHLVERNRIDQSLARGIYVEGENNLVRDNRVFDTGGAPAATASWGMGGSADFIDNTISGGFATAEATQFVYGIVPSASALVRGNIIRGLFKDPGAAGAATGIHLGGFASGVVVRDNNIAAYTAGFTGGYGVWGNDNALCAGNMVTAYFSAIGGCTDGGGNASD